MSNRKVIADLIARGVSIEDTAADLAVDLDVVRAWADEMFAILGVTTTPELAARLTQMKYGNTEVASWDRSMFTTTHQHATAAAAA